MYSNISIDLNNIEYNSYVPFNEWVNYCSDWQNKSTYSHNYYIFIYAIYFFLKWIKNFYNPKFNIPKKDKIFNFFFKEGEYYLINEIQDLLMTILFLRIIQVWYFISLANGVL
jgi:hypothetical protein